MPAPMVLPATEGTPPGGDLLWPVPRGLGRSLLEGRPHRRVPDTSDPTLSPDLRNVSPSLYITYVSCTTQPGSCRSPVLVSLELSSICHFSAGRFSKALAHFTRVPLGNARRPHPQSRWPGLWHPATGKGVQREPLCPQVLVREKPAGRGTRSKASPQPRRWFGCDPPFYDGSSGRSRNSAKVTGLPSKQGHESTWGGASGLRPTHRASPSAPAWEQGRPLAVFQGIWGRDCDVWPERAQTRANQTFNTSRESLSIRGLSSKVNWSVKTINLIKLILRSLLSHA